MNHPTGSICFRADAHAPTPHPPGWTPSDGETAELPECATRSCGWRSRSGREMDTTRFRHRTGNTVSSSDPKDRTDSVPTKVSTRSASRVSRRPLSVAGLTVGPMGQRRSKELNWCMQGVTGAELETTELFFLVGTFVHNVFPGITASSMAAVRWP